MVYDDKIFTIINDYRLPISRGELPIDIFLEGYFKEYIEAIKIAISNTDNRFFRDEFYNNLEREFYLIEELCNGILEIYQLYDSAYMVELYKKLNEVMGKIEKHLYIKEIKTINDFYRIRVENGEKYSRKDLFHIPMSKRELIRPYRYSIAGYPCLYLASYIELCWFECGMPQKFSFSKFRFNPIDRGTLKLIDFSIQPLELISDVEIGYYNHADKKELIDNYLIKYLITYPLRAACSVKVNNKDNPFIEEYIIPQLLLLWIRHNDNFDGVAYLTASAIEAAYEWNAFNLVLPAKDIKQEYCSKLSQMFEISEPVSCDISKIFISYSYKVENVKEFLKELEYAYLEGQSFYLYKEIISLCKSFLLFYDCIVSEKYADAEVLYQTMDTINLFANVIDDNGGVFEKIAIKKAKNWDERILEDKVTKSYNNIIEKFSKDVKLILSILLDSFFSHSSLLGSLV
ncbi:hypothetical protein [Sporanaerobacter acetigenes]|nr:hypothetical protein [Sporanaerobacter acetigenes]